MKRCKIDPSSPSYLSNLQGKHIGYKRKDGYWVLSYGGKQLLAHRVVYMLTYGEIPEGMVIDHIDRNPSNNHPENLRAVTTSVNNMNSRVRCHCRSGHKFIRIETRTKSPSYVVFIRGQSLGSYKTIEEALVVRDMYLKEKM